MYNVRLWSVRHARALERVYRVSMMALRTLDPLWRRLGDARADRLLAAVERPVKGLLFDCQMCGQCALSATGLSCPTNCPKSLRNGPCGGVRRDGMCEVKPEMRCVWVEGWNGSRSQSDPDAIRRPQAPIDHRRVGHSAWLAEIRRGRADAG
jgi:hypothetical protein